MRCKHLVIGLGLAGAAALLWPRAATAAPRSAGHLRVAHERLAAFVAAARIDAAVSVQTVGSSALLYVKPGAAFVAADAAALPRAVDDVPVLIEGWPR